MAAEMDKLLQEEQSLTADEMRRLRRAIDEQLAESEPAVSGNGSAQLQALIDKAWSGESSSRAYRYNIRLAIFPAFSWLPAMTTGIPDPIQPIQSSPVGYP